MGRKKLQTAIASFVHNSFDFSTLRSNFILDVVLRHINIQCIKEIRICVCSISNTLTSVAGFFFPFFNHELDMMVFLQKLSGRSMKKAKFVCEGIELIDIVCVEEITNAFRDFVIQLVQHVHTGNFFWQRVYFHTFRTNSLVSFRTRTSCIYTCFITRTILSSSTCY